MVLHIDATITHPENQDACQMTATSPIPLHRPVRLLGSRDLKATDLIRAFVARILDAGPVRDLLHGLPSA